MYSFGILLSVLVSKAHAWVALPAAQSYISVHKSTTKNPSYLKMSNMIGGSLHGQNSCFLPLQQQEEDFCAPRIIQIAGGYPGITKDEYYAVQSEPAAELGQWTYDFSDPDGPQMGTVAIPGSLAVSSCEDPVVLIAEHTSLGVELPETVKGVVDLITLVDRSKTEFSERKFIVFESEGMLEIGAFEKKTDMPLGCNILGRVELVMIPWLPSMKTSKSGFAEADEYF